MKVHVKKIDHLFHDAVTLICTVDTISLSENSREVVVHITGYVAKNWKQKCENVVVPFWLKSL